MLLVFDGPDGSRDVIVDVHDPNATVADLCRALTPDRPVTSLLVDGRLTTVATPLDRASIGDGSIVRRSDDVGREPTDDDRLQAGRPAPAIDVIGGLDAGRRLPLPEGAAMMLGRRRRDGGPVGGSDRIGTRHAARLEIRDPTISRDQALIRRSAGRVTIESAGGTNPTLLAGVPVTAETPWPIGAVVTCGSVRLLLVDPPSPSASRDALDGGPPWLLRRVPDPEPPAEPEPIPVPDAPAPAGSAMPIGVAAIIGSVALAAVLVLVLGNWMYALFAGLGPVLAALSSLDDRRRRRTTRRRDAHRRRADLDALGDRLLRRREEDRRLSEERLPSAAAAIGLATGGPGGREPAATCWRRRSDAPDAHTIRLGRGSRSWTAPLDGEVRRLPDDVRRLVGRLGRQTGVPVPLPLRPGRPIAIVAPDDRGGVAEAVARSILLQAAVLHGPADLGVSVLAGELRETLWAWVAWLPHTIGIGGHRLLGFDEAGRNRIPPLLRETSDASGAGRRRLVLVDDPAGLATRRGPAREVLRLGRDPDSGIVPVVIVRDGSVPAGCTLLRLRPSGTVTVDDGEPFAADGVARDTARRGARSLARALDPEVDDTDRVLPDRAALGDLLGPETLEPAAIAARWSAVGSDPAPRAVIGVDALGTASIDLRADGPHALVAGTTGSGKSELLRSLVVSLAIESSPDHLTFVLVDFKGGSAFDACARLPHTIGVVTDLDEHLADRALVCLEAELRHREERLRDVGASDLREFRRLTAVDRIAPLPRLVVVIDEFATLATELPEFVEALVGIAQRGRSLGVHLVLATQRPSGVVGEDIRANTALRIALRVQDRSDSDDVVGLPDAVSLPRNRPGRAVVRSGPGETRTMQTAHVGGTSLAARSEPVSIRALGTSPPTDATTDDEGLPSDLELLVERLERAWRRVGGGRPRQVWPDPLPEVLAAPSTESDPCDSRLLVGIADHPERQRHEPHHWTLDGPLLLVGLPGSGATEALAGIALTVAARWGADDVHVHVLDCGRGDLAPLADLPQVGAVVRGAEEERQRRLLEHLGAVLAERRSGSVDGRRRFLIVNDLGAFRDRWDGSADGPWEMLVDLVERGADVGIHVALAAEGAGRAPHRIVTACRQRLILRLGDRADFAGFGIPPASVPDLPVGRAIRPEGTRLVQLATPGEGDARTIDTIARRAGPAHRPPQPIAVLPGVVDLGVLTAPERPLAHHRDDGSLDLLIGVSDHLLLPARLVLAPGAHAIVAGPPRAGRTTALATIALAASTLGRPVLWVGATDRAPDGTVACGADELLETVERLEPVLIAVDDAEDLAEHGGLAAIVGDRRPDRHVIAAARSDRLRGAWSSWLREVRVDRAGVLLDPDRDLDGDLLGVRLPREIPVRRRPGLGWLGGEPPAFAQIARPRLEVRH